MTHTPGPWGKPRWQWRDYQVWAERDDGDTCIAQHIREEADARLIAAAPELLAALEKLMDLGTGYGEASDLIRIICKPAIAKARGEPTT
jgi:hypothetical protein